MCDLSGRGGEQVETGQKKGQKKTDAIHANSLLCPRPKIGLIELHSA